MLIQGKTAVITGGASGMGARTAQRLKHAGANIVLLDNNVESLEQLANKMQASYFVVDVTEPQAVEAVFAKVHKEQGAIHVAINCAGIAPAKRVVGREGPMPLDEFANVININLVGTFNIARVAAGYMTKQETETDSGERGVIINTASVAAYEGQIGQAAYSASKGGIVGMTLPMARELAQFGVRVMTIAPGLIATPMLLNMPQDVQDSLGASVPFPKRLGDPDEFARLAVHIIENEMLNGSVIRLDGAIRLAPK